MLELISMIDLIVLCGLMLILIFLAIIEIISF